MATPRKPKAAGVRSVRGKAKAASNGTTQKPASAKSPATNGNGAAIFSAEMIRVRAYEVFLERGTAVGDELSDWLTAEREITDKFASHD
jgi:hypothetical protein